MQRAPFFLILFFHSALWNADMMAGALPAILSNEDECMRDDRVWGRRGLATRISWITYIQTYESEKIIFV